MGNISCIYLSAAQTLEAGSHHNSISFLHCDTGDVSELNGPLTVAEVMMEFPAQFLCSLSDAVSERNSSGRRICALPANEEMQSLELYLLLPMHRLNSRFSMEEIAFFTTLEAARNVNSKTQKAVKGAISQRKVAPFPGAARSDGFQRRYSSESEGKSADMRSQLALRDLRRTSSLDEGTVSENSRTWRGAANNGMCRSKSWMPKLQTVDEHSVVI